MAQKELYKKVKIKKTVTEDKAIQTWYKGFSTANPDNKSYKLYDIALIKQDIINHFHIRKGEKLSDPDFGTIIWDILFEPLTEQLKQAVISDVNRVLQTETRVSINEVIVTEYENGLQIEATLTYLPYNITESLRFSFDQNNGLI
jgi:phage baseplate assembly protein W|tara:strand:- start:444 stop:878 length:435 start_codon:yes stop_codon:yes gene_type:complete